MITMQAGLHPLLLWFVVAQTLTTPKWALLLFQQECHKCWMRSSIFCGIKYIVHSGWHKLHVHVGRLHACNISDQPIHSVKPHKKKTHHWEGISQVIRETQISKPLLSQTSYSVKPQVFPQIPTATCTLSLFLLEGITVVYPEPIFHPTSKTAWNGETKLSSIPHHKETAWIRTHSSHTHTNWSDSLDGNTRRGLGG